MKMGINEKLVSDLGYEKAYLISILQEKNEALKASELLILSDYAFMSVQAISYHLEWLARNTDYVERIVVNCGKTRRHSYKFKDTQGE